MVGDKTLASAVSKELRNHGWSYATANLPAAYLTGLLAGRRARERGVESAVLDIGLNPPVKGSRVYAALKGAIDAGLQVPHNPEVLPDEERVTGKHIAAGYEHFREDPGTGHMFTRLEGEKADIRSVPKQFQTVKKRLLEIPSGELKVQKKHVAAKAGAPPAKKAVGKVKKVKVVERAPRAQPTKPKPKKLVAKGKGKKGKGTKSKG